MGAYFESFEEAWDAFLARTEPLEAFIEEFEGGTFAGTVWLIVPSPEIKRAALRVQSELEQFTWLRLIPHHFLHVSLTPDAVAALAEPIDLGYARVTCFHTAVVVEVDAPELRTLDPRPTFLPHLTLAVVERPAPPEELRRTLTALRETAIGTERVEEALHVYVEVDRGLAFEPWTIVDRLRLRE